MTEEEIKAYNKALDDVAKYLEDKKSFDWDISYELCMNHTLDYIQSIRR